MILAGRIWDLERNQSNVLVQHDQAVKCIHWVDARGLIVTGSWDRTLKYTPSNMQNTVATVSVNERVYAMDVVGDICVVACGNSIQKSFWPLVIMPLRCQISAKSMEECSTWHLTVPAL